MVEPPQRRIRSLRGTVILFVIALALVLALLVLWNVVLAVDLQRIKELMAERDRETGSAFHWTFIALGSVLFVATIVLISILGAQLVHHVRYTQRLSTFIATFTHELNSPLASIKMFAQTLRRSELSPDERTRFLDLILSDTERLRRQITNVLDTARLDSLLGLRIAPEPTQLGSYLQEFVTEKRLLLRTSPDASLDLRIDTDAVASIDPHAFRNVLDNLLDNAIKYSAPNPPHVTIALDAHPQCVSLEVSDRGAGIPPNDLELIFERFGRSGGHSNRRQGTGLGLWIVHQIVSAHSGRIRARSPGLDQGTTFRIELPLTKVDP